MTGPSPIYALEVESVDKGHGNRWDSGLAESLELKRKNKELIKEKIIITFSGFCLPFGD
jgi:hypothetical protein